MTPDASTIADRIKSIRERIESAAARGRRRADAVRIIGASKTAGVEAVLAAYEHGITDFGENRIQEGVPKVEQVAEAGAHPTWHFIGHLQSNKVTKAVQHFHIIQSVDSVHLAKEISRRASEPVQVMLEINLGNEDSKSGFPFSTEAALLETTSPIFQLPNLRVIGLMTVAPIGDRPEAARPYFQKLAELASTMNLPELSMGMTDDFEVAIEEGATMVRIGRALFGPRA